jgi:phage gp29-like protein
MAKKKSDLITINPYDIVFNQNNWHSVVGLDQQIFRVKTDSTNLKNAMVNAENPQLRNRWLLFQIFANLLVDGYLQGLISQRQNVVLQKKWKITVNGIQNKKMTKKFEGLWFGKFLKYASEAITFGFSFVQISEILNGEVVDVELVPRQYCCPEFDLIRDNYTSLQGALITDSRFRDWIVPIYRDRTDLGELTKVADIQIKKMASLVSYSEYQEKFGTPFRVVMTDITNEDTKKQIAQMLAKMGSNAWSIIDKDDKIEFIMPSGDGSIFSTFLKYIDEQLAIALLGQTLTTASRGSGNRSLGEVHERINESVKREDSEWIEKWVNNQLIPRLISLGVCVEGTFFEWDTDVTVEHKLDLIVKLAEVGYRVDVKELENLLQLKFSNQDNESIPVTPQSIENEVDLDLDEYNTSMQIMNAKTYSDYPQAATNNAKRVLKWVDENGWGGCLTSVGKRRANQLANGEPITRDTIARISAFSRHLNNYTGHDYSEGCANLAVDAWGGKVMIEWCAKKLKEIDGE